MASNGISSLLDISGRALGVQSQSIRVIGNNIANVNTEGYSRRRVELSTVEPNNIGLASFGSGVQIDYTTRIVDKFLNKQLEGQMNERAQAEVKDEFLSRAEALFAVNGEIPTIGSELSEFFTSLEDLAANPSDVALRSAVVEAGRELALTVRSSYEEVATLQRQADSRTGSLVTQLNTITQKISDLNNNIRGTEYQGQQSLGLRDQRDQLLRELSELVSVDTVENADGSLNVMLKNGFGLVTPTGSRQLEFTSGPSFAPVGGYPRGLDGAALGFITYDFDQTATASHVNLTDIFAQGGGEIAGLLELRGVQSATDTTPFDADGSLVDIASRVEAIARDLLVRFNRAYVGPDENGGAANHQSSSFDLNDVNGAYTATPVFGLFTFAGATDTTGTIGLADVTDITATGLGSFAGRIQFAVNTAEEFAAGRDLDSATAGTIGRASGDASNLTGTAGWLGLNQLRTEVVAYSVGNFTANTTIEELYNQTVTYVGSARNTAKAELNAARDRESQVKEFQNSVSGVSLDEEFAKLILYQKAFEASARMIRVGDELLGDVIGLLG